GELQQVAVVGEDADDGVVGPGAGLRLVRARRDGGQLRAGGGGDGAGVVGAPGAVADQSEAEGLHGFAPGCLFRRGGIVSSGAKGDSNRRGQPVNEAAGRRWYEGVTGYQWLVLALASL